MRFMLFILTLFCGISAIAQIPVAPSTPIRPDVYPSRQAAAAALADQIAETLAQAPSVGPMITLTHTAMPSAPAFTNDLAAALQARIPNVPISIDPSRNPKPTTAPAINLIQTLILPNTKGGAFSAILTGPVNAMLMVKYVDKPWADDWATFVNSQPTDAWIVGKTDHPCASSVEADNNARADAARQIVQILRRRYLGNVAHLDDTYLTNWVSGRLLDDGGVHDKFLQRFIRPYGPFWQESILVPSDANTMAQMVVPLMGVANQQRQATFQPIAKTLVLVVVIILLYVFLNWITKGYFSTRLKVAGFALLAIVFVFLFFGLFAAREVRVQTIHEELQTQPGDSQLDH